MLRFQCDMNDVKRTIWFYFVYKNTNNYFVGCQGKNWWESGSTNTEARRNDVFSICWAYDDTRFVFTMLVVLHDTVVHTGASLQVRLGGLTPSWLMHPSWDLQWSFNYKLFCRLGWSNISAQLDRKTWLDLHPQMETRHAFIVLLYRILCNITLVPSYCR